MTEQLTAALPIVHKSNLTMMDHFRDFMNKLARAQLTVYSLTATDDAGDGTVEGDVNATDFIGQGLPPATDTSKFIDLLDVVIIKHKSVVYLYAGLRSKAIGVGGITTVSADFVSI